VELDGRGAIRLTVSGEVGRSYIIEASDDLIHWTQVGMGENTSGSDLFSDQAAGHSIRFYRAALPGNAIR